MRIGIVNDVMMAVEAVRRAVVSGREHEVAWIARDGAEAVELCAKDTPDLILMDLIMPKVDGVEATRRIMARTPCAIVVVTANVTDSTSKVFEAMGAGALDAVNTPVLEHPDAAGGARALLGKIETIRRLIGGGNGRKGAGKSGAGASPASHYYQTLVAIGASAGGPTALAKVLSELPADFPAPIVIVQHVDAQFAKGLAEWLNHQTKLRVRVAVDGETPGAGTVLLPGNSSHLVFVNPTRLSYTHYPEESSCHPSIDVFFKSVDRFWQGDVIGVLLTGMGRDGAEGLRALRARGHHTIAQDQASSAVYGMPKAAVELQAASEILPLDKIAARIRNIVAQKIKLHG